MDALVFVAIGDDDFHALPDFFCDEGVGVAGLLEEPLDGWFEVLVELALKDGTGFLNGEETVLGESTPEVVDVLDDFEHDLVDSELLDEFGVELEHLPAVGHGIELPLPVVEPELGEQGLGHLFWVLDGGELFVGEVHRLDVHVVRFLGLRSLGEGLGVGHLVLLLLFLVVLILGVGLVLGDPERLPDALRLRRVLELLDVVD